MLGMSPAVNARVMIMRRPRTAFGATDQIMAFGKVSEASSISSAVQTDQLPEPNQGSRRQIRHLHICTEQS